MRNTFITEIVSILNNDMQLKEKQLAVSKMRKNRRGNNRILINIIYDMLSTYILPLKHTKSLKLCFDDFSEKNIILLKKILNKSNCNYFNAICSEILWLQKHDIELAKNSIESYYKELNNKNLDKHLYIGLTISICRFYAQCKIPNFDYNEFFKKSIRYVESSYHEDGYGILFILNALTHCKENATTLEQAYEKAILYYEKEKDYKKSVSFLEGLEYFFKTFKKNDKAKEARVRIAINQEKLADQYDWSDPEQAHIIIMHIQEAMDSLYQADSKAHKSERNRLAKRIGPIKNMLLKSLKLISSGEIDITELVKKIKNIVEASSFESLILHISRIIPLKNYTEKLDEFNRSGLLSPFLFSTTVLDQNGRKKCIVPSACGATKEEMLAIIEYMLSKDYAIFANSLIPRILYLAKEKFNFTEESLSFLVEENIFVPNDHKKSFLKGLVAGFNLDLITAMHLLMPQVENGIRCIAQECGAVVYKTHSNGVEECLSLESILDLSEVKECLDETFLFNIRLFYTSTYGFGMRNEICHCLRSDDTLLSDECLAVWWFTLHICCMFSPNLYNRLAEEKQKDK